MARKKKIEKSIETLEKTIEKHKDKVRNYKGKNYALIEYWNNEMRQLEKEKPRRKRLAEDKN